MEKLKQHLKHMLLSNKCTKCGLKQKVGVIFYDYGNEYLCESCDKQKGK